METFATKHGPAGDKVGHRYLVAQQERQGLPAIVGITVVKRDAYRRTAVFAGMSGSPVYIDGKLVGAISYSFPFAKEPICGITPIEQMISIFEQKQPLERGTLSDPRAVSFSELSASASLPELPKSAASGLVAGIGQTSGLMAVAGQSFQRIATPVPAAQR